MNYSKAHNMAKVLGFMYKISTFTIKSGAPRINNVISSKGYCTNQKSLLSTSLCRSICANSCKQVRTTPDFNILPSRSRTLLNMDITKKFCTYNTHNLFNSLGIHCKCSQSSRTILDISIAKTYSLLAMSPGICSKSSRRGKMFYYRSFHSGRTLQLPTSTPGKVLDIKPPPKKKKKKKMPPKLKEGNKKVVAYATAEEYDIEKLRMTLDSQGWYNLTPLHQVSSEMGDVLHATPKYPVSEHEKEILLFENGTVVFWDVPDTEITEVIKFLRFHGNGTYDIDLSNAEIESMEFNLVKNQQTGLFKNVLVLNMEGNNPEGKEQMFLEKYTCSNILSQSVKLAIWEFEADKFVEEMVELTENLREGKGIGMKRKDVLRNIGTAYEFRHNIHRSDLEDTPDFYWDREELELLYNRLYNSFAIKKRTVVMKEKLDYCCDLLNLIDTKLSDQKHVRLEWMIIVLILVEVFFELLGFFRGRKD